MKLYVFLNEQDNIIKQVRAENHDQAVAQTGLDWNTSFYSESIPEWEAKEEYVSCEGFECGMPILFSSDDAKYMRGLGLPLLCINCTHAHLETNERDRVELDA